MKLFFQTTILLLIITLSLTGCKKEICSPEHSTQIVKEGLGEDIHNRILSEVEVKFSGTALVVVNGETTLMNSYQYDRKRKGCELSIEPETSFWIASLSKQFCAASIVLLAQNNQIDLNASISDYLPDLPNDKSAITIHQLLTHTSGLSGDENDLGSKENAIDVILNVEMIGSPGEKYSYSNYGYQLLAIIVEAITAEPFEAYLEANFFAPLGMNFTGNACDQQKWKKLNFAPYGKGAKRWAKSNPQLWDINYSYKGSTGVLTNISDLYIWHQSLMNNTILSEASTDLLFTRYVGTDNDTFYGYGWYVFDTENGPVISHAGYDDFIQQGSSFRYYEDHDVLIVILHNYGSYMDGKVPVLIRNMIAEEIF